MSNPFLKEVSDYVKDTDYLEESLLQRAQYISRMTGDPFQDVYEWIKRKTKSSDVSDKRFLPFDPAVKLLTRDKETMDRSLSVVTFSEHLKNIEKEQLITSPALTSYYNHRERRSLSGQYIQVNLGKRKAQKAEKFKYQMLGNKPMENFYQNAQTSTKYLNNSLSGARSSPGNIFFCRSAHPTLTSTCRTATSIANAHNEKFIMGNRYYFSKSVVIANITTVIQRHDPVKMRAAIEAFDLHIPSDEELLQIVERSSQMYFRKIKAMHDIAKLLSSLTPEERVCFAYAGDLYHLHKFNPELVTTILDEMSERSKETTDIENAETIMGSCHGDIKLHAAFLCGELIKGQQLHDVKKSHPENYGIIAKTVEKFTNTIFKYKPLIDAFWIQDIPPNNISQTALMPRLAVPLSDTDSTVFTTQYWTKLVRKKDKVDFSHKSACVANSVTFLTAQIVRHWMATLSTNFGIPNEFRSVISMKNEYYTPLLALTTVAKHYVMLNTVCEGNILKTPELDIKGVNMRNSNWPAPVREAHRNWLKTTFNDIMDKGQISIHDFLKVPYQQEVDIVNSVQRGEYAYMSKMRVNERSSYKVPESSNYVYHELWQEVFADKYGHIADPPYRAIKIPVKLDKSIHIKRWLENIDDKAFVERMERFISKTKRTAWNNFLLPEGVLQATGIPKEVISAVDLRKIIGSTLGGFYMAMAAFGINLADEKQARFLIDTYKPMPV